MPYDYRGDTWSRGDPFEMLKLLIWALWFITFRHSHFGVWTPSLASIHSSPVYMLNAGNWVVFRWKSNVSKIRKLLLASCILGWKMGYQTTIKINLFPRPPPHPPTHFKTTFNSIHDLKLYFGHLWNMLLNMVNKRRSEYREEVQYLNTRHTDPLCFF